MYRLGIITLLLFVHFANGAKKVRYRKASHSVKKSGILADEDDLHQFLRRITPPKHILNAGLIYEYEDDYPPLTT